MKKPSSKIRENIARLQEQLKQAETREAERLGRIALKAGLGEFEIDDGELQTAFGDIALRFRDGSKRSTGRKVGPGRQGIPSREAPLTVATAASGAEEA